MLKSIQPIYQYVFPTALCRRQNKSLIPPRKRNQKVESPWCCWITVGVWYPGPLYCISSISQAVARAPIQRKQHTRQTIITLCGRRATILFFKFIYLLWERQRAGEGQRENPKQALGCQHRDRCHPLNRLSYSGAPSLDVLPLISLYGLEQALKFLYALVFSPSYVLILSKLPYYFFKKRNTLDLFIIKAFPNRTY